jgi:hypothetical protein
MSDSGETSPERATLALMEKVLRGLRIREDEAQLLLRTFGLEPSATLEERMEKVEDRIVEDGSLKFAALYYQKDPRTIRRWCEKGYFPSATRTAGKHWRIPYDQIEEAEVRMEKKNGRNPKTIFGTSDWRNFRAAMRRVFRGIRTAREIEGALMDLSSTDFRHQRSPLSESSIDLLKKASENGSLAALRLKAAARRIKAGHPQKMVTGLQLATELNLSRATLYRAPFGARSVRAAIREAET